MRDLGEQGTLLDNACDRGLRRIVGRFEGPAAHVAMERGTPGGAMASASSASRSL